MLKDKVGPLRLRKNVSVQLLMKKVALKLLFLFTVLCLNAITLAKNNNMQLSPKGR